MDIKVKQRLVGACVLVGLAAVILPVVFHGGNVEDRNISVSSQIPTPPKKPALAQIVFEQQQQDMAEQQGLRQQVAARQQIEPPTTQTDAEKFIANSKVKSLANLTTKQITRSYAENDTHPEIKSDAVLSTKAQRPTQHTNIVSAKSTIKHNTNHASKKAPEAWIIQVASLSDKKHSHALRNQLRKQGYAAYLQHLKSKKGDRYRVLVGPMIKKTEAEKVLAHLTKKTKLKAIILSWVTPNGLRVT